MLFFVGLIVVTLSVIVGYTMHYGDLKLLWQPNEILIILGGALGASLIANPNNVLISSLKSLSFLVKRKPHDKLEYTELLLFFLNITKLLKSKGMLEAESHVDDPFNSEIFQQSPSILKNKSSTNFICDNLRLMTMGVENPHQFQDIVDQEIELIEFTYRNPSKTFLTIGDSLPALGIVAAVLGVIVTMRSILEPPEILGSLIAAALVGTFTGVLLAYGLFNPIGHFLIKYSDYQIRYIECIKVGMVSYLNGNPPSVIVEFMRKVIPDDVRPSFNELDRLINIKTGRAK
jgi:chemotaxis protein MotA